MTLFIVLLALAQAPEVVVQTGHDAPMQVITSLDKRFALISHKTGAKLWHLPTRREMRTFATAKPRALAATSDLRRIAILHESGLSALTSRAQLEKLQPRRGPG